MGNSQQRADSANSPISSADRAKLAAILGRLGSDQAGERDAAALAATKFIRKLNTTWPEVLQGVSQAEALSAYVYERIKKRAERKAKLEERRADPKWQERSFRARCRRNWSKIVWDIEYNWRFATDEEKELVKMLRTAKQGQPARTTENAVLLWQIARQIDQRRRAQDEAKDEARQQRWRNSRAGWEFCRNAIRDNAEFLASDEERAWFKQRNSRRAYDENEVAALWDLWMVIIDRRAEERRRRSEMAVAAE